MSESSHPKKVWKKSTKALLILVVITAAVLAFAEFGLRLCGYLIARVQTPDLTRTNIAEADYLIVCFGDSYTKGTGASSPEFSYPAQLERILKRRYKNTGFFVMNEAVGGSNSSELIEHMRSRLPFYRRPPDLIIVTTFNNNTWNLHRSSALLEEYVPEASKKRWIERIESMRVGKLAVILSDRGKNIAERLANVSRDDWFSFANKIMKNGSHKSNPITQEEYIFFQKWLEHDMAEIQGVARSRGSPLLFGIYHNSRYSPFNEMIEKSAISFSVPYCKAPKNGALWQKLGWMSDIPNHPNDKGYAVFAEHIADCMESKGFTPKAKNER